MGAWPNQLHCPPPPQKPNRKATKPHGTNQFLLRKKARDCGGRVVAHGVEECLLLFWKPVVPGCAPGSPGLSSPPSLSTAAEAGGINPRDAGVHWRIWV